MTSLYDERHHDKWRDKPQTGRMYFNIYNGFQSYNLEFIKNSSMSMWKRWTTKSSRGYVWAIHWEGTWEADKHTQDVQPYLGVVDAYYSSRAIRNLNLSFHEEFPSSKKASSHVEGEMSAALSQVHMGRDLGSGNRRPPQWRQLTAVAVPAPHM